MERRRTYTVYFKEEHSGVCESLFYRYNSFSEDMFKGSPLNIKIIGDALRFKAFESEMRKINCEFYYSELRIYSKREIEEAEYFHIGYLPYPWENEPEKDAAFYGTDFQGNSYDVDTREQKSPLYVNLSKVKKYYISQIIPEIIIDDKTRKSFADNNFTGIEFGECYDYKGRNYGEYYQLKILSELPPIRTEMMYIIPAYKNLLQPIVNGVDRRKHNIVRSEFVYKKDDFASAKDFNLSQEFFGCGNYRQQAIIVSKKVYNWFKEKKYRWLNSFEPINFI